MLLFVGFGPVVNAEEVSQDNTYRINWSSYFLRGSSGTHRYEINASFIPRDGVVEEEPSTHVDLVNYGVYTMVQTYQYIDTSSDLISKKDFKYTIRFNDVYFSAYLFFNDEANTEFYFRNPDNARVLIGFTDNTYLYIDDVELTSVEGSASVSASFTFVPEKDVESIELQLSKSFADLNVNATSVNVTRDPGEYGGDNSHFIVIDQSSEEAGLLDSILGFVKSIKEGVLNLPTLIWEKISNGLQSLFIPSDEYIIQFKNDIDILLSERLGAVYEVVDITLNSWEQIQDYDETNTIKLPRIRHYFRDGSSDGTWFTFGGQQVQIVPDGFEEIVTTLKIIIGIVCTVAFVNGLKKRYDEIMKG